MMYKQNRNRHEPGTLLFSNRAGVEGAEKCEGVGVEEIMNNEQGMMK